MKYCHNCGSSMEDSFQFCAKCGAQSVPSEYESVVEERKDVSKMKEEVSACTEETQSNKTPPASRKKSVGCGCLIIIVAIISLMSCFGSCEANSSKHEEKTQEKVEVNKPNVEVGLLNVMDYASVSGEKLIELLGDPDEIIEGTSIGPFSVPCVVYTYLFTDRIGNAHFTLVNDRVVKFTSTHKYPFKNKDQILEELGINCKGGCEKVKDADSALRYICPTKEVDEVKIKCINGDVFTLLEVIYAMAYYKEWYMSLSLKEQTRLQMDAEERIEKILNFPRTADFPSILKWTFRKNLFYTVVASYVDAKNAYGVEIRTNFEIVYSRMTGKVVRLVFGDEVVDNGYVPTQELIRLFVEEGKKNLQTKSKTEASLSSSPTEESPSARQMIAYIEESTKGIEKNTSDMVDAICLLAKKDAASISEEKVEEAIAFIRKNHKALHKDDQTMECALYYGYLLDAAFDDSDARSRMGWETVKKVKYVYRKLETPPKDEKMQDDDNIEEGEQIRK